jgi:hypothetical protein
MSTDHPDEPVLTVTGKPKRRLHIQQPGVDKAAHRDGRRLYTAIYHRKVVPIPEFLQKAGGPTMETVTRLQWLRGDYYGHGQPLPRETPKPRRSKYPKPEPNIQE